MVSPHFMGNELAYELGGRYDSGKFGNEGPSVYSMKAGVMQWQELGISRMDGGTPSCVSEMWQN